MIERALNRLIAFSYVSLCLKLLPTSMTEETESMQQYMKTIFFFFRYFHTYGNALALIWFLALIITYIYLQGDFFDWSPPYFLSTRSTRISLSARDCKGICT